MFKLSLEPDLQDIEEEIISDFLRSKFNSDINDENTKSASYSNTFVKYLLDQGFFSDKLSDIVAETRPFLKIKMGFIKISNDKSDINQNEKKFMEAYQNAKSSWLKEKDTIKEYLMYSADLKRNIYTLKTAARIITEIEKYLSDTHSPN